MAAMRRDELFAAGALDGARHYRAIMRRNRLIEPAARPLH
jgi:hypothetical protein